MIIKYILIHILVYCFVTKSTVSGNTYYTLHDDDGIESYEKMLPEGQMNCSFDIYYYDLVGSAYRCFLESYQDIKNKENVKVLNIVGEHQVNKSNKDIIAFHDQRTDDNLHYFPRGLNNIFGELKLVFINNGRLKEIHQTDLKPFTRLSRLDLDNNDIEILHDGLFKFNLELKFISFAHNLLFLIEPHVFDHLSNLLWLNLSSNPCINLNSNGNVTILKNIISEVTCDNSEYIAVENNLNNFYDSLTCINSESLPIFNDKLQKLQNLFQISDLFQSKALKLKIDKISSWKSENLWTLKTKVFNIDKSVINSKLEIISSLYDVRSALNDDIIHMNNKVVDVSNEIKIMMTNAKDFVNRRIESLSKDALSKTNLNNTFMEIIRVYNMTKSLETLTNNSTKTLKDDLTTRISLIDDKLLSLNDRISSIESSITNLSSIIQEYIMINTQSNNQFHSELKDRLQITNYKIDKNSLIQDYSKSILIGTCALLITLVLVIIYKKILMRPDYLDY